jgi:hypothetical protein
MATGPIRAVEGDEEEAGSLEDTSPADRGCARVMGPIQGAPPARSESAIGG